MRMMRITKMLVEAPFPLLLLTLSPSPSNIFQLLFQPELRKAPPRLAESKIQKPRTTKRSASFDNMPWVPIRRIGRSVPPGTENTVSTLRKKLVVILLVFPCLPPDCH